MSDETPSAHITEHSATVRLGNGQGLDEAAFRRLDENAQMQVLTGLERTRAVIDAYCSDRDDAYIKPLSQLKILSSEVLGKHGLILSAEKLKEYYNDLFQGLARGGFKVGDIKNLLTDAREDIETLIVALRRKTGDDSPLGDTVNLSSIGAQVAQEVEKEAHPKAYADPAETGKTSEAGTGRWTARRKSYARTRDAEPPAYATPEFFADLNTYLKTLGPEVLQSLNAYCRGEGRYADIDAGVRYDLGSGLMGGMFLKKEIAASLEREADGSIKVVEPEEARSRFIRRLQEVQADRFADRGGGGRGGR